MISVRPSFQIWQKLHTPAPPQYKYWYGGGGLHWNRSICLSISLSVPPPPPSGELQTQKLKSHLMRTLSLKVLPLKPGVGQYIAMHAMLTARDFFLANFYPSGPFTCIFSKTFPEFFLC